MPKRKKHKRRFNPSRKQSALVQGQTKQPRKKYGKKWYVLHGILSVFWLIVTTIGGNMLNNISPIWAFILFVLSLCALLGYWTWIVTGRISNWKPFASKVTRLVTVLLVLGAAIGATPYYIEYFITNQSTIEMPTFVDDSTQILVYYGNRPNPVIHTRTTVGELKQNPHAVLRIGTGNNTQDIVYVHIEERKLYVDSSVFAGIYDKEKHIFFPPVALKDNAFSKTPTDWKIYQNNTAIEIVNEVGLPVLVLEYKSPYKIIISGIFVTPMGICKVDNSEEDAIFQLGDTLSELGTYRVDRIFVHSIFDVFRSERTYILSEYER
jgi:hypothetical protein